MPRARAKKSRKSRQTITHHLSHRRISTSRHSGDLYAIDGRQVIASTAHRSAVSCARVPLRSELFTYSLLWCRSFGKHKQNQHSARSFAVHGRYVRVRCMVIEINLSIAISAQKTLSCNLLCFPEPRNSTNYQITAIRHNQFAWILFFSCGAVSKIQANSFYLHV